MSGRGAVLAFVLSLIAGAALAAGLTARDFAYLKTHWGLDRDSGVVRAMTAEEQATLHGMINDPAYRGYPHTIEHNVADYLFQIESCYSWVSSHPASEPCPQAAVRPKSPGWEVAERSCNACHLTGTADAPSFFRLAQEGGWDEKRLAAAVASGHRMSPISLSETELKELAAYIASLRK